MRPIGMAEMNRVFEVVDELELSRESIQVPLLPEGEGSVRRLDNGRFEIVLPADGNLDDWLPSLAARLRELARL